MLHCLLMALLVPQMSHMEQNLPVAPQWLSFLPQRDAPLLSVLPQELGYMMQNSSVETLLITHHLVHCT